MKRRSSILANYGIEIPKNASILDFGCGAGATVYSLRDQGYVDTVGYDVQDYLKLRNPQDRASFFIAEPGVTKLPFSDNQFDLIISEQVFEHVMDQAGLFQELYRVMRPGGCALHVIPARYRPREGHIYVPFGNIFTHRWYYKFWALMGIRNEFQQGCTADEVADRNAFYYVSSLNYVPSSLYKVVWKRLGYQHYWVESENWLASQRSLIRSIGSMSRALPIIGWLYRTFHTRMCLLIKPAN